MAHWHSLAQLIELLEPLQLLHFLKPPFGCRQRKPNSFRLGAEKFSKFFNAHALDGGEFAGLELQNSTKLRALIFS